MAREAGPTLDRLSSIKEDGSRYHIQTADVKGRFVTRRRAVYAVLIAIYVLLPFVRIGGHPAVFLDIEARRFFLFGATFNAQDAWLIFFLLMTVGFGLLFFTAWLGRVWCGWACPQTVFLEGVYRRVERLFEGPREKRIRMAAGPLTSAIALRKAAKHATYLLISLALAHVFVSFFVSLKSLFAMVQQDPREHWVAFLWVMTATALFYFNFAWFREQLCIVICPYGRLQSVMQDKHSIVIGYDVRRGEPRGKLTRADRAAKARTIALPQLPADAMELRATPQPAGHLELRATPQPAAAPVLHATPLEALAAEAAGAIPAGAIPAGAIPAGAIPAGAIPAGAIPAGTLSAGTLSAGVPAKGDCIDCRRCVVVCPTGIDIRNGLQMECIGCAQCIDACDDVMDKIGRPRGLIRYDSLAGLDGEKRQLLRPRLLAYGGALAIVAVGLFVGSTVGRNPFEANLLRVRGAPYVFDAGTIRNQFELHLVNKNAADTEFTIEVGVPDHAAVVIPRRTVELGSLESFRLPIFVSVSEADFRLPFEIEVEVTDGASTKHKVVEARFLGPISPRKQP